MVGVNEPPLQSDHNWTAWKRLIGKVACDLPDPLGNTERAEITVQLWRDDDIIGDVMHVGPEHVFVADTSLTADAARRLADLLTTAAATIDGNRSVQPVTT